MWHAVGHAVGMAVGTDELQRVCSFSWLLRA